MEQYEEIIRGVRKREFSQIVVGIPKSNQAIAIMVLKIGLSVNANGGNNEGIKCKKRFIFLKCR